MRVRSLRRPFYDTIYDELNVVLIVNVNLDVLDLLCSLLVTGSNLLYRLDALISIFP